MAQYVGGNLNRFGLRTEDVRRGLPEPIQEILSQAPDSKTATYADTRQMLQTWVDDLKAAEKTLSAVKDPNVKLPLHVGLIKVDLLGIGKPVEARFLLSRAGVSQQQADAEQFLIDFDRGDADWLAGYCNFLCAWGEVLLAIDGQELFNCTAHLFFEKVDTPYPFLLEDHGNVDSIVGVDRPLVSDIRAFIHLWRFELKEPERMKAALAHLEDMQRHAKSMWKFYLAETDNEREWIPNPQQTGVLEIKVTQEMVDTWLVVLDEEHDASFKQQEGFRYSARDVAVKRAAELDIPVVLGSATPSLESLRNARDGRYSWHKLRERATSASLPAWRVLDLRQQKTVNGLTRPALDAIGETLERGEQVRPPHGQAAGAVGVGQAVGGQGLAG